MDRITEWYPDFTEEALKGRDGFTVLAYTKEAALKEILTMADRDEFHDVEILGSWAVDDWETQDRLESQDYY